MANLDIERGFPGRVIAGVDEVGRGALSGPVFTAAVVLPEDFGDRHADILERLCDSKTLTKKRRLRLYFDMMDAGVPAALGAASCRETEQHGIFGATMAAMQRAVFLLPIGIAGLPARPDLLLVDGPATPDFDPRWQIECRPLIDGDAYCASISAASVIAKVARDALMARLATRYPGYGWERNAGYGVPEHYAGLREFGPTPHHRRNFRISDRRPHAA